MKCPLCDSKNDKFLNHKNRSFYHCDNCDGIYVDKEDYLDVEEEKQRYSTHNNTIENKGYVKMFQRFLDDTVRKFSDDINTVLDYGCGPGPVLAELLKKDGFEVDYYDPVFYPEIDESKKYDLVTCTEVFEHFHNPKENIKKILKKIKKGGYLAVMTYFHDGKDVFKNWFYKDDPTHVFFYNTNTFKYIADEFNLEILFNNSTKHVLLKKPD
ncbi:class I SAM-dependent methyltransferase [Geotoga petraea]|uniref:Methyltransferase domain-containing protein n=1 Tax=Geotoga petraea TaxID=28234 RepID=A0A1G6PUX4_9BACT|nr:class I SAM-dependent methyltransferase [Geotoga petraea]SDC83326.1 Methyltransferase domain-containing protein [Geotoga petraea]